ncbi:AsmA family protein [Carboxylicivirga sp. N1Y90]|uniref:AsmA family protein n=1 Tax=Carboxylicivirga fragile TaxID=3417571 RepID=UPI003D33889E|nr:hypothetical protein [Marinilabiliaceae bacterium N1Y90]
MKLSLKILAYLLLTIFTILLALILIAEFAENTITKKTLQHVNKSLNADINIGNVNFSLINAFPLASIELEDVSIKQAYKDSANDLSEEIITLNKASLSIQVLPLLDDIINIEEIKLKGGCLLYAINKDSVTNIDFLISEPETTETDTTPSSINLSLKSLELDNITCIYKDESSKTKAQFHLNHAQADAKLNKDITSANLIGKASISNCQFPNTPIHLLEVAKIDFDINYLNKLLKLGFLRINTDDSQFAIKGKIKLDDHFESELYIYDTELNLAQLQKYIPEDIKEENSIKSIGGRVTLGADIKGALLDSILPNIDLKVNISDASVKTKDYPEISKLELALNYSNGKDCNMATSVVDIQQFKFETHESKVQLVATVENFDLPKFKLNSQLELNLGEFKTYVPDSLVKDLSGMLTASVRTSGRMPQTFSMDYVDRLLKTTMLDLQLKQVNIAMDSINQVSNLNGTLSYSDQNFDIKNLSCFLPSYDLKIHPSAIEGRFEGKLSELNSMALKVDTVSFNANSSHINGMAYYQNGTTPSYDINSTIDINLNDWKSFVPDSLVSKFTGNILADINSKGSFNPDSIVDDAMELLFTHSKLDVETKQLSVATWDEKYNIEDFNGRFFLADDSISLEDITGSFNHIDFSADSSSCTNIYKGYILNQAEKINAYGFIQLGTIDYAKLSELIPADTATTQADNNEPELANYTFEAKGKFGVDKVIYEKAVLENIGGLFSINDSLYIIDKLRVDGFSGSTKTSIRYELHSDNKTKISFKNETDNLDIYQLLNDFDDFKAYGNNYITHEQLKGTLSIKRIDGSMVFIGDSIDMSSIMIGADTITLKDGRLKGHEMAIEMAKLYDMEELEDIQFQTINTKLFIYRNFMYFPATNIVNNAMDVNVYGKQEFGEDCQHHVRLYTSQLMNKGKNERIEKKQQRKEEKEDGKTKGMMVLYAMYQIKDGETKIKPESKESSDRRQIRAQLFVQEGGLKGVFHPKSINYKTGVE